MVCRVTVHNSADLSPYRMTIWREFRIPCDMYLSYKPKLVCDPNDCIAAMSAGTGMIHAFACKNLDEA